MLTVVIPTKGLWLVLLSFNDWSTLAADAKISKLKEFYSLIYVQNNPVQEVTSACWGADTCWSRIAAAFLRAQSEDKGTRLN